MEPLPTSTLADALVDVSQARNSEREGIWATTNADARQVFSHREQLLDPTVRPAMIKSIRDYYNTYWLLRHFMTHESPPLPPELLRHITEYAYAGAGLLIPFHLSLFEPRPPPVTGSFKICVRCRPMTGDEKAKTNYHIISKTHNHNLNLHVGKLARSGNRLTTEHRVYTFDKIFSESANNDDVAATTLSHVTGGGTVVCYGQTGTGKTYSFAAIIRGIAERLADIKVVGTPTSFVNMQFYELYGKKCFDLQNDRAPLKILSDSSEKVHARGATITAFQLTLPSETRDARIARFEQLLVKPLQLRFQVATERNPFSSRSHSIFTLTIPPILQDSPDPPINPELPTPQVEIPDVAHPAYSLIGPISLRLVDLAGSERNADTAKMSALDHRESADINTALMSLKECIQYYKRPNKKCPYRAHLLTRVLRDCFTSAGHKTVVMACVSPATTDGIHTLNTLNHVAIMQMEPDKADKKYTRCNSGAGERPKVEQNGVIEYVNVEVPLIEGGAGFNKDVALWSASDVKKWIAVANNGNFSHIVLPAGLDGKGLMSLNELGLSDLFEQMFDEREARGANEGQQWVIGSGEGGDEGTEARERGVFETGRALFQALRMEQKKIDSVHAEEKRCSDKVYRINEK